MAAVGGTWHGLVALQRLVARLSRRVARIWAPISTALHDSMDRLEDRDRAKRNGSGTSTPMRHAAGAARSQSAESVQSSVRSQSVQPESAESTESTESVEAGERAAAAEPAAESEEAEDPVDRPRQTRYDVARVISKSSVGRPRESPAISGPIPEIPASDRNERTIDLRASEGSDADQGAGSARRTR